MKRILLHIPILLFVLVSACHTEQVEFSHVLSSTYPILSRGGTEEASLANGSQILLNASGGLSVENGIFTYNGSSWSNGQELHWTDESMETTITALYPTYTDNRYTSENLYAKGMLEDILIAQETLPEKGEINLQFKHLFSSLTLFIEPTLDANIHELALSIPVQVKAISPQDGSFSLTDQTHTVVQSRNESHAYSFILPPCDDCTLSLRITWKDGNVKDVPFSPHTFQSGTRYECNITSTDSRPGIRTADDLIDFSRLINGYEPYQNKTLTDFGEEIDGVMTFYLLEDISLTEGQCDSLQAIGEDEDVPFSHTFDGKGHIISNLVLPEADGYSGLFAFLAPTGYIQNLHLTQATTIQEPKSTHIGTLVAYNEGIINNCSVTHSTLRNINEGFVGGLCSFSYGTILNCYTQRNTIYTASDAFIGAICSTIKGNIFNSYSFQNTFIIKGSTFYIGSIAGRSIQQSEFNIENCYIYHKNPTKRWGAAVGQAYQGCIQHFYYNQDTLCYKSNKQTSTSNNTLLYDSSFNIDTVHISTLLNQWIDTTGKESYSNFTFRRWKVSNDGSACFQ